MIAIKGMTMSKDSEGCISCAFHWNGDSTTYCLAQSHPYSPAGERLHHINYDDPNNPYGGEEGLTQEEICGKPLGVFDGNTCADCSKIDAIRADIEGDMLFYEEDNCNDKDTGFVMGLQHTLDIIDKYMK